MYTGKKLSIWPLPGGQQNYIGTLQKCLEYVSKNNPTYAELKKWFTEGNNGVKGEYVLTNYVRVMKSQFSLVEEDHSSKLRLTADAKRYLLKKDPEILYQMLESGISGIKEIMDILKTGPQRLDVIEEQLKKTLKKEWKGLNPTRHRLAWLISCGKIKRTGHNYQRSDS